MADCIELKGSLQVKQPLDGSLNAQVPLEGQPIQLIGSAGGGLFFNNIYSEDLVLDLAKGNKHNVYLEGDVNLSLSNLTPGMVFAVRIVQNPQGNHNVNWFETINWVDGGIEPAITYTPNRADMYVFLNTGTNTFDGYIAGVDIPVD